MLARITLEPLKEALAHSPAVALLGPRQVGKTTLAKYIAKTINAVYLDLESPEDLIKLSDPTAYLRNHSGKLIILDEIQRAPGLFMTLRGIIDHNREQGNRFGQFLLLGSASMDLLRQSSESLAGRIKHLEMSGLNVLETKEGMQQQLWVRGGFPESFLAQTDAWAMDWLEDLIRTYLERDIPQLGFRVPSERLRRFWTMLAHCQGETVNTAKLASNLEVTSKTISHYIDILSELLLVRRLNPWHQNTKKRLVKSPRYYIRDSGIQHRLLGIHNYDSLLSNPALGKSWEGFVIENICSVLPRHAETYYYRTAAGAEIDLLIRFPNGDIWAVEIKHGSKPKLGKHFSKTCQEIGANKQFVVYGGDESFALDAETMVVSLGRFLTTIQSKFAS